jgi:hypothetical protein
MAGQPPDAPGPATWRDALGSPRIWLWEIGVSAFGGAWFGAVGPFGTFLRGPIEDRLLCFVLLSPAVALLYGLACRLALKLCRDLKVSPWLGLTAAILAVSLPCSTVISFVVTRFLNITPPSLPSLEWYLQTVVVMLPCALGYLAIRGLLTKPITSPPVEDGALRLAPAIAFATEAKKVLPLAARLSPALGREIVALQAEDHYVRVFTTEGSTLIFMRLSDAIEELGGLEGMQVHRSWWVARSAVLRTLGSGRKMQLELTNGVTAPVARSQGPQVKAFASGSRAGGPATGASPADRN